MLGYTTAKQALAEGFTHHGYYYGIPVWLSEDGKDALYVGAKWYPLEFLIHVFHYIEGFIQFITRQERGFLFWVGDRIE